MGIYQYSCIPPHNRLHHPAYPSSSNTDQAKIKQDLEEEVENLKSRHQEVELNLRQEIAQLEADSSSLIQLETLKVQHQEVEDSLRQEIVKLEAEISDLKSSSNEG